jgi:hypothetical protein
VRNKLQRSVLTGELSSSDWLHVDVAKFADVPDLGFRNHRFQTVPFRFLLALSLLVRPLRFSLGALTNLVLVTLFILAAVAFLPARWFSNRSGVTHFWRDE